MTAYVYRIFDADERLIYVGSTVNVFNRLESHKARWWAHQAARVKAKVYATIDAARAAERAAIASENPRWNVMGSRRIWTPSDPSQDYLDYITAVTTTGNPNTTYNRAHLSRVRNELELRYPEPAAS